eukprot:s1460_g9.t1
MELLRSIFLCPRRAALPEVELGDLEDGMGPINTSLRMEHNGGPLIGKAQKAEEIEGAGPLEPPEVATLGLENVAEMQSILLQLQSTEDLDQTLQDALDLARGEVDVLGRVWESQRMILMKKGIDSGKKVLHQKLQELFKEWSWKTSEATSKEALEALLEAPGQKDLLNTATTSAIQELLQVTDTCQKHLKQRIELESCLQCEDFDRARVKALLEHEEALKGRVLLEFKLRRALAMPLFIPKHAFVFPHVKEPEPGSSGLWMIRCGVDEIQTSVVTSTCFRYQPGGPATRSPRQRAGIRDKDSRVPPWSFVDRFCTGDRIREVEVQKSEANQQFLSEFLAQFCEKIPNDSELEDPNIFERFGSTLGELAGW